jgi:hypothetical protein
MAHYMLQKRPDGGSDWQDVEGRSYSFARRLPNAKRLCRNDRVLFYRPKGSGTPQDGCIYAVATVDQVEIGAGQLVDAELREYVEFLLPVLLDDVGDPRSNPQHSFQPVDREYFLRVLTLAGANEGQEE